MNSAVGLLGEGGAALIGATILNLLSLIVEDQIELPDRERSRLVALVDESSTLGGADYARMMSELGKYGASFVLVTQSLTKLDPIDAALRPTAFANIDSLTVFQVSAEDGRYLTPELGGDLEVADLVSQDDYECYARWSSNGRHNSAFSLHIDPPVPLDTSRVAELAIRSAEQFGRSRSEVAREVDRVLTNRGIKVTPFVAVLPGAAGGRLQTLIRQFEHTVGANGFMLACLQNSSVPESPRLVRWHNPIEAAVRFESGGVRRTLRPDGAGEVLHGDQSHEFLLEWDRGTERIAVLIQKLDRYASYFGSVSSAPTSACLLVVTSSPGREDVVWSAVGAAFQKAG